MIVQDDDFKVATAIGEHRLERRANVLLFVAGGDEDADRICGLGFAIRNWAIDEQVQQKQTGGDARKNQRHQSKEVQVHLRPCSRLNFSPRSFALNPRHQS